MITGVSQHALDRFIQRSGIKFQSTQAALEKLEKIIKTARHIEPKRKSNDGDVWMAKGWRMIVSDGVVMTLYLNESVQRKKLKNEISEA